MFDWKKFWRSLAFFIIPTKLLTVVETNLIQVTSNKNIEN